MTSAFFLPAAVCSALLWIMLRSAASRLPLDVPNARSLHGRPIPRIGGIGVFAGLAICATAGVIPFAPPLLVAFALAAVSLVDDFSHLPVVLRLAAHFAAASFVAWHVLAPMNSIELAFLVVAIAWLTNLFNFMDGSDGLAAGMALIGFGTYALAAWLAGDGDLAVLCVAIASASAGFLLYNFPPVSVFLGDAGSVPLGFLAGAIGISGWRNDLWPLWFPVLVFAPFIGDATLTLVKRALRRERVWQAHREHYYQRLVQMGFGHRGTAAVGYGVMLLCAAAAFYGRNREFTLQTIVLGAAFVFLGALGAWIDLRWRRHTRP